MKRNPKEPGQDLEQAVKDAGVNRMKKYVLRLFVSGVTPRSTRAIANIKKICEKHLKGRYELEVVDIYQQPERARDEQVIAVPTLVKTLPLPLRRFIGDLSDTEKVLVGLEVVAGEGVGAEEKEKMGQRKQGVEEEREKI